MDRSRRQFLKWSGAASLAYGMSLSGCSPDMKEKHSSPNVLFMCIDDLNDWVGSLRGHPQAQTPNIDRLMNSGMNFTNAHCSAPVCSASRNSLLTGLMPSSTGWYTNSKFLDSVEETLQDIPTLPEHFKNNGYHTLAGGKIFHHGTSDYRHDKQWHESLPHYEITNQYLLDRGYGYAQFGVNDHKYFPFPVDGGQIVQTYGPNVAGKSLCWGALDRKDIPKGGIMPDEYIAKWATKNLLRSYDKPFFMAVGFVRPHVPFTAPKEYFERFPIEDIIMPDIIDDEMSDIPLYGKAMALGIFPDGDHKAVTDIGMTYWRELIRANLACIAFVDDQVGKVLDALENSLHKNNTLTILWSDHGQNFGEHNSWRKQNLWEESTRVPLVIRQPSQMRGHQCHEAISLLDVYPTLAELCNLPPVDTNQGISLTALLDNPTAKRDRPALTTWGYKNHAVRDERWRYIQYRDGTEELYDRQSDEHEHHNLAEKPEYVDTKKALQKWLPTENRLPPGMETFEGDFLEERINRWQQANGIPDWLT